MYFIQRKFGRKETRSSVVEGDVKKVLFCAKDANYDDKRLY